MATENTVRSIALGLAGVEEKPYRNGTSFRAGGKLMATLWTERNEAFIKATPRQQRDLIKGNPKAFFSAAKSWGKQGWTGIRLESIDRTQLARALGFSRENVAGPRKKD